MTIFALSTAPGRAAVAVVRLSGPSARQAVKNLVRGDLPPPRYASLRTIRDPQTGQLIDRGLVLWLPHPGSQTGEDMAEFHVHGGRAVVQSLLDAIARIPGMRHAEPGEFTRRAVLNGKIDLIAAEAVADLVNSDTARQMHQALEQITGSLGSLYSDWRDRLIEQLAYIETAIDFADEEIPDDLVEQIVEPIAALECEMTRHLDDDMRSQRLRDGLRVVILGAPNTGKSSLLNALAGTDAAIVSEEAGTTRDVIDVALDVDGFAVRISDTAGLRASPGHIEEEGIRRGLGRAENADLCILVTDATRFRETHDTIKMYELRNSLVVCNKSDLKNAPDMAGLIGISCKTGDGVDRLLTEMAHHFDEKWCGSELAPTNARHRANLVQSLSSLTSARNLVADDVALAAEELRHAVTAFGRLTGRVDIEDVLDVVFSEFCIGK